MDGQHTKGIIGWLVRSGIATHAGQAKHILIVVAILCIGVTLIVVSRGPSGERYGNFNAAYEENPGAFE